MENENINVNEAAETATNEATEKTYTEAEVKALLQSESDKRVTQALNKQKAKYEKQISLAALDADERQKVENADRISELEALVAELEAERNRSEMKTALAARGLDVGFADILSISGDIEAAQAQIEALDKLFKASVKAEVENRLKGTAPKGNGGSKPTITKESRRNMSVKELADMKRSNPDAYRNLYN